jgi:hypothetical protein
MTTRAAWSGLAIFLAWSAIDLVLHDWLLRPVYDSAASLWRPTDEMSIPLIYGVTFVLIACFVAIYARLITEKSLVSGLRFGTLYGLAIGVSVGFGTYIHMPVPLALAWGWFLGGWLKAIVAGAIVGALMK